MIKYRNIILFTNLAVLWSITNKYASAQEIGPAYFSNIMGYTKKDLVETQVQEPDAELLWSRCYHNKDTLQIFVMIYKRGTFLDSEMVEKLNAEQKIAPDSCAHAPDPPSDFWLFGNGLGPYTTGVFYTDGTSFDYVILVVAPLNSPDPTGTDGFNKFLPSKSVDRMNKLSEVWKESFPYLKKIAKSFKNE